MLQMKGGELQIKYNQTNGRIYTRIIKRSKRVDIVATSEHESRVKEMLGNATGKDGNGYPLWEGISAYDLARLIAKDVEHSHE